MKRFSATLAAALLAAPMPAREGKAAEYLPDANYFGTVTTESQDGKHACASLAGRAALPAPGTPVTIVVPAVPQRIVKGTVAARASAGCTRYFEANETSQFVEISITNGRFEPHELGILALPEATVTTAGAQAGATLGRQQLRFFECSGSEGIHIGVRTAGARPSILWHDYLHLGIDVDPTCRQADQAAIDALTRTFHGNAPGRADRGHARRLEHGHD
jgi:hypothetical protein